MLKRRDERSSTASRCRSGPRSPRTRPRARPSRQGRARATPTRPAGRLDPLQARRRAVVDREHAPAVVRARRGTRWWRWCRARSGSSCGSRRRRVRARRAGRSPAARPRRRAPSRASDSSARGARREPRDDLGERVLGRHARRRAARGRAPPPLRERATHHLDRVGRATHRPTTRVRGALVALSWVDRNARRRPVSSGGGEAAVASRRRYMT